MTKSAIWASLRFLANFVATIAAVGELRHQNALMKQALNTIALCGRANRDALNTDSILATRRTPILVEEFEGRARRQFE